MIHKLLGIVLINTLYVAAGIVANWNFNTILDSAFTDASGNGNNGVLDALTSGSP